MENMNYDVGDAFATIENELLDSMIRNMKRHRAEEAEEGFQWEQWQAKQLAGLEEYRRKHADRLNARYNSINAKMRMAILQANAAGGMAQEKAILKAIRKGAKLHKASDKLQGEFFRINEQKMDALLDAVEHDMLRAESAILRMHDDQVRRAIFNAQVYANSGAGTYEKAVDMAVKDYASTGLNCVKYKDGKQVNIKSYAEMALRTASKRAYLSGEGTKRQEWDIHTVIINKRGNPCPLCLPWVGRVMIDDVWSGGTAVEAKKMGYPLISQAMNAGLYHPNCRDSHTTYFPGISTYPDKKWKKSELAAIEKNVKQEARRQYAERQEEKFDRLERCAMDPENKRVYAARREEWRAKSGQNREKNIVNSMPNAIMNLTEEELGALLRYKSSESYVINEALRAGKLTDEQRMFVNKLDSALSKIPKYHGNLARTINFSAYPDADERLRNFLDEFEIGKDRKIPQYWSTSCKRGYDEHPDVIIYIQDAKKGRDIRTVGLDEQEVLYERNTRFTVIGKAFADGVWNLLLREV